MRLAIQGEAGSFSHEAALRLDSDAAVLSCSVSAEVFRAVLSGEVDGAVIPIENSLAGPVVEHYDLLLASAVTVESESLLRIRHNLIAAPGATLEALRRVYSHPVALAQCRRFFLEHPHLEAVPAYDTAGSVKRLMEVANFGGPSRGEFDAAIASRQAAVHYGGEILAESIEDNPENFTRFFLIRRSGEAHPASDADKVSLAFALENRPGTLVAALSVFAGLGTNLTKIESRPVHGKPWEYIFYVDFQLSSAAVADAALERLKEHCSMAKELGRYRAAGG